MHCNSPDQDLFTGFVTGLQRQTHFCGQIAVRGMIHRRCVGHEGDDHFLFESVSGTRIPMAGNAQ
jgi:hypothetical protein